jgi:hypothetical protein
MLDAPQDYPVYIGGEPQEGLRGEAGILHVVHELLYGHLSGATRASMDVTLVVKVDPNGNPRIERAEIGEVNTEFIGTLKAQREAAPLLMMPTSSAYA